MFDAPTVAQLAQAIDALRSGDLVLESTSAPVSSAATPAAEVDYSRDAEQLISALPSTLPAAVGEARTVFLTGATGFLGAFVLADLLERRGVHKVFVHTRASNASAAAQRVRDALASRGLWRDAWASGAVEAVVGDLAAPRLGLSDSDWDRVAREVDVIVHNGALVHWVYPYSKLRAANVLSTVAAIELAAAHKSKALAFVSSTSALDTEHYVHLGDCLLYTSPSPRDRG